MTKFIGQSKQRLKLSQAVTRERLVRSGLADLRLDERDPDLKRFSAVLRSPVFRKDLKLRGVSRQAVRKLIGA